MESTYHSISSCLLNTKLIQHGFTSILGFAQLNGNRFDTFVALGPKPNPSSPSGLFNLPLSVTDIGQIYPVSIPNNSLNLLDNVGNFILHNQLIM